MAGAAQPGPTCGHTNPINVNDGTSCRAPSPRPGTLVSRLWSPFAYVGSALEYSYDTSVTNLERTYEWVHGESRLDYIGARCLLKAYWKGLEDAPQAIFDETGYQLISILSGILKTLFYIMMGIAITVLIGGGIGSAFGALVGGIGAVPGAVAGGEIGFQIALFALRWAGVGYLIEYIVGGAEEMYDPLRNGVTWAWSARRLGSPGQENEIDRAGNELARAIGILIRLILQAILAYLIGKAAVSATGATIGAARAVVSEARVAELVSKIRASKFGDGLADWVKDNWRNLQANPKLKATQVEDQVSRPTTGGGRTKTEAASEEQKTPPKVRSNKAPKYEPPDEESDDEEVEPSDKEKAKAAALSARAGAIANGKTSGASSALVINGKAYTGLSDNAGGGAISEPVQKLYDQVPDLLQSPFHGQCAEPRALSAAIKAAGGDENTTFEQAKQMLSGGTSVATYIKSGDTIKACNSCNDVLNRLGVKDGSQ